MDGVRFSFCVLFAYAALTFGIAGVEPTDWILFGRVLLISMSVWLPMMGVAAIFLSVREVRKGPAGLRPWQLLRAVPWKDAIWPPLLYVGLVATFGIFKQRVLVLAPFRYDRMFSGWDRAIFGVDPWRLSHPSAALTHFLGTAYYGWYAPMMLGILACTFLTRKPRLRDRYVGAFVLTWIFVGSALPFVMPAAGPCFWSDFVSGPNPYAGLMLDLHRDVALRYNPVLDTQAYLLRAYGKQTVFGAGISAMPSMHVALATLYACGTWKINRYLGLCFVLFAGLIWWASVHLGWHYFVDGLVAIPATLLVWWFCGQLYPESPPKAHWQALPVAAE